MEDDEDTYTYIHKFKCRACGLHFALFTWAEERADPWCPECGQHNGAFIHWTEESDKQIFQFVPGEAQIVGIS